MTYKEALAEILGKDHPALASDNIGGVYKCPKDAFRGANEECVLDAGPLVDDNCRACWNREYEGEEFKPDYWDDDEEEEED